jgi:hypothetical protein
LYCNSRPPIFVFNRNGRHLIRGSPTYEYVMCTIPTAVLDTIRSYISDLIKSQPNDCPGVQENFKSGH